MFQTKKNKMMQRLLMIAIMMIGLFFLNPNQAAAQRINIAVGKTATQSSTLDNPCNPGANKAVDGNDDGNFNNCSVTHTNLEDQAWWQVDLQNELTITQIEINNRTDCCGERLFPKEGGVQFPFEVKFSSDAINWTPYNDSMIDNSGMLSGSIISESISVALKNVKARFVRVQLRGTGILSLAEVKVFMDATTVAKITNYDVSKSGWTFRNFGPSSTEDTDLTAVDLIQMFGAKNVCIKGSTAADCVLYETAEKWRQEKINGAGKGHCLGMSIASLRLMRGIAFRGKTKPADWKTDATVTGNLVRDASIDNYITYFQIAQEFDEISNNVNNSTTKSPSETLKFITDTLKGGNAFIALAFWQKGYQRGHAVVPYKVVDLGNDDFRIYIYDNNFPVSLG